MKISLEMPDSFIRVVDGEDEHGNPVRGIVINGIVAGYIDCHETLSNADWEDTLNHVFARRTMNMFLEHFDWREPHITRDSPTGSPMRFNNWAEFERLDSNS